MKIAIVVLLASAAITRAHAAGVVFESFEDGLGDWTANTTQTLVEPVAGGGNPGGWVRTSNPDETSFGVVGIVNTAPAYVGALADGNYDVSVSLRFLEGEFTDAQLRWRYRDSTFNGWYKPVDGSFLGDWRSFGFAFNTEWDDATAIEAGWVREDDSVPFATLWDDIYSAEVRLVGEGLLVAGIDTYRIEVADVAPVPAPASLALFGLALSWTAARWRRRA